MIFLNFVLANTPFNRKTTLKKDNVELFRMSEYDLDSSNVGRRVQAIKMGLEILKCAYSLESSMRDAIMKELNFPILVQEFLTTKYPMRDYKCSTVQLRSSEDASYTMHYDGRGRPVSDLIEQWHVPEFNSDYYFPLTSQVYENRHTFKQDDMTNFWAVLDTSIDNSLLFRIDKQDFYTPNLEPFDFYLFNSLRVLHARRWSENDFVVTADVRCVYK